MTPTELTNFRIRFSLNQKEFALLIGVTFQAVQLWERGERKIPETTIRLIKLFIKYPQLMKEFNDAN